MSREELFWGSGVLGVKRALVGKWWLDLCVFEAGRLHVIQCDQVCWA
jgi:hypothetical protein